MTVYRETFDGSGLPVISVLETHANVGIDPTGPRFVDTIVNQSSALVTATTDVPTVTAARINALSASSRIFADQNAVEAAITTAITNANTAGTVGRLRIKVGDAPWLTVEFDRSAVGFGLATITTTLNNALAPHTGVTVSLPVPANGPLVIQAGA